MSAYMLTIEDAAGRRMTTEVTADDIGSGDARDRIIDAADCLTTVFLHQTGVAFALRPGEVIRR